MLDPPTTDFPIPDHTFTTYLLSRLLSLLVLYIQSFPRSDSTVPTTLFLLEYFPSWHFLHDGVAYFFFTLTLSGTLPWFMNTLYMTRRVHYHIPEEYTYHGLLIPDYISRFSNRVWKSLRT